jgi:uncharacterized protein YndB with AHSA1/START domain
MKFSTREDISAPIEQVYDALVDFDAFERAVLRRGLDAVRVDNLSAPGVGMQWKSKFKFRGKPRNMISEVTALDRPERFVLTSQVSGLDAVVSLDLLALSPRQTRVSLDVEIKPTSLSSRLFLQSLRLAKAGLNRRFKKGFHKYLHSTVG